jgi:long-subunit fatty acid transport protein
MSARKTRARNLGLAACIAMAPAAAHAGGFDLTGQPIDIIFEEGNYIEGRVGIVAPTVEGSNPLFGDFGDNAETTPFFNGGAKTDFTDRISGAIIFDTPFLRSTEYDKGLYIGTAADVSAYTLTAVGRFKFNDNFSVYAGPRVQVAAVDLQGPTRNLQAVPVFPETPIPIYQIDVEDEGIGFVVGAAIEIPAYKARLAVTYNSEIEHEFDSTEILLSPVGPVAIPGSFEIHTPQSVNVDLQAPITTSTLVRANIRWADWGGVDFDPPGFRANFGRPVVEYTEDVFTYRLTVAQRLNENFAAFVTGSYEEDGGEEGSLFKTVDGGYSLGGGLIIDSGEGLRVTLGAEYRWLDAINDPQVPGFPASDFGDPTAIAASMKVGYTF